MLCFADNQLGNAETLLCWSIFTEHFSRSSQRIRAIRKSCQRAANPYNYCFFRLQHVILNCSMLSSPRESCTTILPLCSCACHSLVQGGVTSWAGYIPQVIYPRFQGALPMQDLCHLAQACQWHALAAAHTLGLLVASHPGAGRASAAQPGCTKTHGAHRRLLSLGSACWWEVGRPSIAPRRGSARPSSGRAGV